MRSGDRARTIAVATVLAILLQTVLPRFAWAAPPAPELTAPVDGAAVSAPRPTVSWQFSAGANTYAAEIADNGNFFGPFASGWIPDTSYAPPSDLQVNTLYYWRVKASGVGGVSPPSATWRFWMPLTLVSPASGASATLTPTLDWSDYKVGAAVSGSNPQNDSRQYQVQVATTSDFSSGIAVDMSRTVSNLTVAAGALASDTTYYWRVRVSSLDGTSGWSETRSFQSPPAPPGSPAPSSPGNGSTVDSWRPLLSWGAVPGATSYTVHYKFVGATDATKRVASGLTATSYQLDTFFAGDGSANNRNYEWWVEARNESGSAFSDRWTFWTPPPTRPPAPGQIDPGNDTQVSSVVPVFDWTDTSHTKTYGVQVGTGKNGAGTAITGQVAFPNNLTASTWLYQSSFPLQYNRNYYWQVTSYSINGLGDPNLRTSSPILSFRTPAPPGPLAASPADGAVATSRTPTLTWSAPPASTTTGVTSYRVQVVAGTDFTALLLVDTTVGGTSTSYALTVPVQYDAVYSWRVSFTDSNGTSGWSAPWTFRGPSPPLGPTPATPANGSTEDSKTPTLTWGAVAEAATYTLQVSASSDFAGALIVDTTLDATAGTSYTLTSPLGYGSTAYWRIRYGNSTDTSQWSEVWSFQIAQPTGPDPVAPADGATVDTRTPTLSWSAVPEAQTYTLQVASDAGFTSPLVVAATVDATIASSYTLTTPLTYSATYYWRVSYANAIDSSGWSQVRTFTAPPPPIPTAPAPQTPGSAAAGSIVGFRPSFDWSDSTEAASYGFQLSRNAAFTSLVVEQTGLSVSSFTLAADLDPSSTYYWRSTASNTSGTSDWSVVFSFTTPPPPPVAPTLQSPSNGVTTPSTRPRFEWSDSSGATFYVLEIASDAAFGAVVTSTTVTSSEYDLATFLQPGTAYFWRVRAASDASGTGPWSPAFTFTTPTLPPPGVPLLLTPADGATIAVLAPTLDWQDDHTSTSYTFQLSTSSTFASTLVNTTTPASEYVRPSWAELADGTTYFWRVRGVNSDGTSTVTGDWSPTWSFRTPAVPAVPVLTSPANAAAVNTVQPTLTIDAVSGATTYQVQISTAPWFPNPILMTSSTTELTPPAPLAYGTQYYWRASAKNAAGTSAWSAARTFTTPAAPAPPEAPGLTAPVGGVLVGNARPTLDWTDVTGATKYRVEWTKSPTFAWTEAGRDNLTTSSFTLDVDLTYATAYYWRARATGSGGDGGWSAIGSFQTPAGPPALPDLLLPAAGANAESRQPKLDWADAANATSYQVQVSTDAAFGTTVIDTTATASELTPGAPLATGTTYHWRVKAINGVGDSGWTAGRSFVVPAPPGAATLVDPADGATVTTFRPTLDWDDVAAATGYEVQHSTSPTFAFNVTSAAATASTYTIPTNLPHNIDVYWRARAVNGGGPGPWAAARRFHTPSTPPPATEPPVTPALLQPTDATTTSSVLPSFSWDPADRANSYRLQVSKDQTFATGVENHSTTVTSFTLTTDLVYSTKYYWRVQALNNIGATSSVTRGFTTPPPPPPAAPTLATPADASTIDTLSPSFDWSDSPFATGYRIQVSTASGFATLALNTTVGTSTYTMPAWQKLSTGTTYYWRVHAYNANGSGSWSTVLTFTTPAAPPTPQPPVAPTLVAPGAADGGAPPTIDSLKPAFDWAAQSDATGYRIQISRNVGFTSLFINTTVATDTFSMPAWQSLTAGTQYWWRVQGTNSVGAGAWSPVFTFVTPAQTTTPPAAPALTSPAAGVTITSARPAFDWGDVTGATGYRLQVSASSTFGSTVLDEVVTSGSSFTPSSDLAPGTHHWRVSATNAVGTGVWSASRSFVVPAPTAPVPGVPNLSSPGAAVGGSVPTIDTLRPSFSWSSVTGATSYRIQLAKNSAMSSPVVNTTTTNASFPAGSSDLTKGAQYWWRVQAINSAGTSAWSTIFTFKVPAVPAAPALSSPGSGVTVTSVRPELDWNSVAGADRYQVQVSTSSSFGTKVVDATVTSGTSYTPTSDLARNTTYYWRVTATNDVAGTSPPSTVRSFKTPT